MTMNFKIVTILIIVPVIHANIKVDLNIIDLEHDTERQVDFSGTNSTVISEQEIKTFKLYVENLKDAVKEYSGQRPDDVYLHSPTPWGDLYKVYHWPEVTRTLTPQVARIIKDSSQPCILQKNNFYNNSSVNATFNVKVYEKVENTVTSSWEKEGEMSVGLEILYNIVLSSLLGNTSFSYKSKWGESVKKSENIVIGSETGVQVTLKPQQRIVAELYARRGTMEVKVDYLASLSGSTAVNYASTHKGHHFWSYDINSVMSSAGLKKTVESSEMIQIGFYLDSKVIIKDLHSQEVVHTAPI